MGCAGEAFGMRACMHACMSRTGVGRVQEHAYLPTRRACTLLVWFRQGLTCMRMQACLAWWTVVSPFGGWGSTLALLFVLVVAAIKAFLEDLKRHQEDRATNGSLAHRVSADGALCRLCVPHCMPCTIYFGSVFGILVAMLVMTWLLIASISKPAHQP